VLCMSCRQQRADVCALQAIASPTRKDIAQKERERLRQQAKAKKDLLEKMRADQNKDSSDGDVRGTSQQTVLTAVLMLCAVQAERTQARLTFLLKQAEIFQHFAPNVLAEGQKQKK
jgi:SWI/SNF-related matrix-associated actin-dependent regulator of chromatin subfamily A member 5